MGTADRLVLGFDLGSTVAKVVLATVDGRIVARSQGLQLTRQPGPGLAEQDSAEWWTTFCALVSEVLAPIPSSQRRHLAAVVISSHFPTLLVTDDDGQALAPALLYADTRADGVVAAASELTGATLLGDELLPKLLWLREERPRVYRRIRRIFNPQDYLVFRLTGAHLLDHHTASRLGGMLDVQALAWRDDVLAHLGLGDRALPELRRPGELAGVVSKSAAATSGVPEGTAVLVGLGDTLAALIGTGVVRRGEVYLNYGTTTTADVCTWDIESYLRDPAPLGEGIPYREVTYAVLGPALSWAGRGIEPGSREPDLAALDRAAEALGTRLDAPYALPYFHEHSLSGARAQTPAIVGLDLQHGRADLHRALLESFGYAIRAGLDDAGYHRPDLGRYVASGGGAASIIWRQIVTDVLGVEQEWHPGTDGALGVAMLGAWATGADGTFRERLGNWVGPGQTTLPDSHASSVHEVRYAIWHRLHAAIVSAIRPAAVPEQEWRPA